MPGSGATSEVAAHEGLGNDEPGVRSSPRATRGAEGAAPRPPDPEQAISPSQKGRAVLNVAAARFRVKRKKWGRVVGQKDIVSDVSLTVRSGETLAIMGPSGAGKTTFLDFLTMEGSGGERTGYVDINGKRLTPARFKQSCSYVPQHDQGWAFLTCRETLLYAADFYLRVGTAEKNKRVEELLTRMGLQSCADTKVGNEFIKGLSGGQRRRLSLATAMLKDPLVIFLDEVTSGLDAASAASIAAFLQQLARTADVIIACTIHQPSAKVFADFDSLLLLSSGRVAYSGKVSGAQDYFASIGYAIPAQENPADFFLDSVNADFTDKAHVEAVLQAWRNYRPTGPAIESSHSEGLEARRSPNWFMQVAVLFRRSLKLALRDPTVYVSRIVAFMFADSFFSIVYVESRERNQSQVFNKFWLIIWHMGVPCMFSMAAALGQNLEFVSMRREVKAGMYSVSAYLAAQHLIQLPFIAALSVSVVGVSGYGIANWNPDGFGEVVLVVALLLFSFECAAQFFGVAFRHPLLGLFFVTAVWFASFLFAGFLVPEDDVPMPLRLLAYVSPMKWASKAVAFIEFHGVEFEGAQLDASSPTGFSCPTVECFGRTGIQVLTTLQRTAVKHLETEDQLLLDCGMLLAIGVFFRILYFATTWYKCRSSQVVKRPPVEAAGGPQAELNAEV